MGSFKKSELELELDGIRIRPVGNISKNYQAGLMLGEICSYPSRSSDSVQLW